MSHGGDAPPANHLRTALTVVLAVAVAALAIVTLRAVFHEPPPAISGVVISQDGTPVAGATVATRDQSTVTFADGRFRLETELRNDWVTVSHPDHETRVRAARAGEVVLVRLTPDPAATVTMHFTGDVMFGRRFYDPNEDGDTSDGLLAPGAGVDEHLALLQPIEPLLAAADLTIVNLESPLIDEPWFDPTGVRPERFHQTKEYVFASEPAAAAALAAAGVDVVDLGNNHMYDALEDGVTSTIEALDAAGVLHYGAGRDADEAWDPAVVEVAGRSFAFLGCTSITGEEHPLDYVAGPDKAGAAACAEDEIRTRVAAAAARYDTVVFSVHGGYEYGRIASPRVQALSRAATEAGARLVVDHHPHVAGGFELADGNLTAWTMGNFVFDQTVWPTFGSYLLAVGIRDDEVVRAYAEPLMIERYLPRGLTGQRADAIIREAVGRVAGPFLIEDGAMEVDLAGAATTRREVVALTGPPDDGSIVRLAPGTTFAGAGSTGAGSTGTVRQGRDLLVFGGFEDEAVDPDRHTGSFWDLTGEDRQSGPLSAYSGEAGAEISREQRREFDVLLAPIHRVLVDPGAELSVVGMVRTDGNSRVDVQLSWYPDTRDGSSSQTVVTVVSQPDSDWQPFRIDVTVPDGIVAVGLYVRLAPPVSGVARAHLDDLRIVEWAPAGTEPSPLYDHLRVTGTVDVTIAGDHLPGAAAWSVPRQPVALVDGVVWRREVSPPPPTTVPDPAAAGVEPGDPGLTSDG